MNPAGPTSRKKQRLSAPGKLKNKPVVPSLLKAILAGIIFAFLSFTGTVGAGVYGFGLVFTPVMLLALAGTVVSIALVGIMLMLKKSAPKPNKKATVVVSDEALNSKQVQKEEAIAEPTTVPETVPVVTTAPAPSSEPAPLSEPAPSFESLALSEPSVSHPPVPSPEHRINPTSERLSSVPMPIVPLILGPAPLSPAPQLLEFPPVPESSESSKLSHSEKIPELISDAEASGPPSPVVLSAPNNAQSISAPIGENSEEELLSVEPEIALAPLAQRALHKVQFESLLKNWEEVSNTGVAYPDKVEERGLVLLPKSHAEYKLIHLLHNWWIQESSLIADNSTVGTPLMECLQMILANHQSRSFLHKHEGVGLPTSLMRSMMSAQNTQCAIPYIINIMEHYLHMSIVKDDANNDANNDLNNDAAITKERHFISCFNLAWEYNNVDVLKAMCAQWPDEAHKHFNKAGVIHLLVQKLLKKAESWSMVQHLLDTKSLGKYIDVSIRSIILPPFLKLWMESAQWDLLKNAAMHSPKELKAYFNSPIQGTGFETIYKQCYRQNGWTPFMAFLDEYVPGISDVELEKLLSITGPKGHSIINPNVEKCPSSAADMPLSTGGAKNALQIVVAKLFEARDWGQENDARTISKLIDVLINKGAKKDDGVGDAQLGIIESYSEEAARVDLPEVIEEIEELPVALTEPPLIPLMPTLDFFSLQTFIFDKTVIEKLKNKDHLMDEPFFDQIQTALEQQSHKNLCLLSENLQVLLDLLSADNSAGIIQLLTKNALLTKITDSLVSMEESMPCLEKIIALVYKSKILSAKHRTEQMRSPASAILAALPEHTKMLKETVRVYLKKVLSACNSKLLTSLIAHYRSLINSQGEDMIADILKKLVTTVNHLSIDEMSQLEILLNLKLELMPLIQDDVLVPLFLSVVSAPAPDFRVATALYYSLSSDEMRQNANECLHISNYDRHNAFFNKWLVAHPESTCSARRRRM